MSVLHEAKYILGNWLSWYMYMFVFSLGEINVTCVTKIRNLQIQKRVFGLENVVCYHFHYIGE